MSESTRSERNATIADKQEKQIAALQRQSIDATDKARHDHLIFRGILGDRKGEDVSESVINFIQDAFDHDMNAYHITFAKRMGKPKNSSHANKLSKALSFPSFPPYCLQSGSLHSYPSPSD